MPNIEFAGFLYNNAGTAIAGATVELFPRNTTGSASESTTTSSTGYWAMSESTEGRYDVRITSGSSVRFLKYDASAQMTSLEVASLRVRNPADTFEYDVVPAAIVADRTLNLPLITATRTLIANDTAITDSENIVFGTGGDATIDYDGTDLVISTAVVGSGDLKITGGSVLVADSEGVTLGTGKDATIQYDGSDLVISPAAVGTGDVKISGGSLEVVDSEGVTFGTGGDASIQYDGSNLIVAPAQVGTGDLVLSGGGVSIPDTEPLILGTGGDAQILWSTGDSDNHALVIAVGDSNQGLHVTDLNAKATDWDIAATTHPNVYIHSNTTPATDFLRLGDHDGTNAVIDVVGGTTLKLMIAGSAELDLTATALAPSTSDGNALGTGSLMWADLFLASASVIDWNNGDVSLTHASNKLTLSGGDLETAAGFGVKVVAATNTIFDFGTSSDLILGRFDANPLTMYVRNSRNTFASPSAAAADDDLFKIQVQAYQNGGYRNAAAILVEADTGFNSETSAADSPGKIVFQTTANSTNDLDEVTTITSDGALLMLNRSGDPGARANRSGIFAKDVSTSSELFALDEAGNTTQLSPHNPETGEWYFYTVNRETRRGLRVDMERLVKWLDKKFGTEFVTEFSLGD